MKTHILTNALNPLVHPAVASMECFKLIVTMEDLLEQERQSEATVGLLEGISKLGDNEQATELLSHVVELHGGDPEAVSLESLGTIIPAVRALFGWGKKREPEVNKEPRYLKELMEFLNKYYLNQAWLSKQTFVSGNVSGADLAEALTRNNKFSPETFAADLTKYAGELKAFATKYLAAAQKHSDEIEALDEKLIAAVKALDSQQPDYEDQVMVLFRDTVKKMRAVSDPVKLAGTHFKMLGNAQTAIKQWRYSGDPGANCDGAINVLIKPVAPVAEVPAVTPETVKTLVSAIISLYETSHMLDESKPQWCDHSDGDHGFMRIAEGKDERLWSEYGGLMYWQAHARRLFWDLGLEKNTSIAVIAVLKWIDRSIKTQ